MSDVFAYGTLMFGDILEAVCGEGWPSEPASLRHYARRAVRGAVYPAAMAVPGEVIRGVLVRGLSQTALGRLDEFEGELYRRVELTVRTDTETAALALVYVARDRYLDRLSELAWDPERFANDHRARYVAGCRAYRVRRYGE
ncbi:MAG: gamma-glutamylcyclotransferase family protein [Pseudomonadota bacterium]